MHQDSQADRRAEAEGMVLDQLWRSSQFGEPPRGNTDLKRELLNRIGVMNDYIDALISQEMDVTRAALAVLRR